MLLQFCWYNIVLVINVKFSYLITESDSLKTVKFILKYKLELSERLVKKLKYSGQILSNSLPVHINAPVHTGDVIEVLIDFADINEEICPENMDLEILYEDDSIIALQQAALHGSPPHKLPFSDRYYGKRCNALYVEKGIMNQDTPVSQA